MYWSGLGKESQGTVELFSDIRGDTQWSLGHIDEPQRQISSEDLVT